METRLVDPRILHPNPWNPNSVTPENMQKLERSIVDRGFVTAVVVRELPTGELQILGGKHRVETAIKLGLKLIPMINLGLIHDVEAKKIGLVDNSRYGTDDSISLAKLYEEIGMSSEELAEFLPFSQMEFDLISKSVEIDLDELDMLVDEGDTSPAPDAKSRPTKTHDVLKFRLSLSDAERVRQLVEQTMKAEGLVDDDELTSAGSALAFLLLNSDSE